MTPPAQAAEAPPAAPVAQAGPAAPSTPPPPAPQDLDAAAPAGTPTPSSVPIGEGEEITVVGRDRRGDPLGGVNKETYEAAQKVDKAVVGPVALAYRKQIPKPLRSGLRNFIWNLREPVVAVNFLLQHKVGKAFETVGRFAINTTIGVAGVIDVAKRKPFRLPRRRNGFANTLGFYGVKPGPYLFLPLIGSTTVRDLIGNIADQAAPIGPIRPFSGGAATIPLAVLSAVDYRAEFDDELEALRAQKRPYVALREFYLQRRQAEIDALHGKRPYPPPPTKSVDVILNPDAAAAPPSAEVPAAAAPPPVEPLK